MAAIPVLKSPIVLVHGLFGFDRVQMGGWTLAHYFRSIPEMLRAAGNRVLLARLNPIGGIAERAAQLKTLIEAESPHEPVHLIGHSMGGLDCRHMISASRWPARVVADDSRYAAPRQRLCRLGREAIRAVGLSRVRVLRPALSSLQRPYHARCKVFNTETPNAPGVRYFSVAGRYQTDWLTPEWQLPAGIISRIEGPNDGLVSVASARWGEICDIWDSDHMNLVNWSHPLAATFRQSPDRTHEYAGAGGPAGGGGILTHCFRPWTGGLSEATRESLLA